MQPKGHKRKKSIQDTPVDLSKMRMAINTYNSLKKELEDIEETEVELEKLKEHLDALGDILLNAKKPKLSFSAVTNQDLTKLGIQRGFLSFNQETILRRLSAKDKVFNIECKHLTERINEIYAHVNMAYEAGARMILDAVLMSLWRITDCPGAVNQGAARVSVLPELKPPTDGVSIINPETGFELWLTGSVDYCVLQYPDISDNKERVLALSSQDSEEVILKTLQLAEGYIFLFEAKRVEGRAALKSHAPEAISQALALCQFLKQNEMRFILADGVSWIFCSLRRDQGRWIVYTSPDTQMPKEQIVDLSPNTAVDE